MHKTKLKQGVHTHQPTAWVGICVPLAKVCLMHRLICWPGQYLTHAHSLITQTVAAIGQLFRPYWGSSAWHSRWVNEQGKSPCIKDPGQAVGWCMCAPCFKFVSLQWNPALQPPRL